MIGWNGVSQRRQVRARALGTSAMTLAAMLASPAFAQCAPEPTVANGTTTCRGSDTDGIRVTTAGTTLDIAGGAVVSNTQGPAITVEVPSASFLGTTITIAGQVMGGSQSGISLLTGAAGQFGGGTTRLALTIGSGGVLTGATALTMAQTAGNGSGQLLASVDNAGTITGTAGVALRGDVATASNGFVTSYSGFSAITNRAGGAITGSILGPVAVLTNAGVIDGGGASALAGGNAGASYPFTISPGVWTNSGTIRSNGGAATIASATIGTLTNAGTIANAGSGAALSSANLVIQNTGRIGSGGSVAIAGTGFVNLVNRGTITGGVVTGNASSTIDSSQGRIDGSVTFGAGNDTLVVRYDGTATPVTGITGTINAGSGTNTQALAVSADTMIATPVTLLAGFGQLAIATDAGVTTTLGSGFVAPATIQVRGAGTLVNRAAIATAGTAFVLEGVSSPAIQRFVNEGTIQTGLTTGFAIAATSGGFSQIVNNGTITAAGSGINSFQASVANTGTLTAAATGVTLFGNGLTNAGAIRSTGGIGAQLSGNVGTASTNSGTIQGATAGVQTSGYLTNTGTITATGAGGTAVRLDAYGVLFNNAGGVVGNGGQAVSGTSFNQTVVNAGTINGTVSLTSSFQSGSSQRYISQGAGVLNGNLVLGPDGLLFTDLVNAGPGQFAGITGTVTATSGALLRYRVVGTQAAVLGPVGPFASAAYELTDGASLTLTAPSTVTRQLLLAGTGRVDLTANLATTTGAALMVTSPLSTLASTGTPAGTLAITSRGTIAVTRAVGSTSFTTTAGASLGSGDSFTNVGTITVTDRNASSISTAVSAGVGGTIVNAGSILLDGGIGTMGAAVTNSGTIAQVDGGAAARGIVGARTLDNSGTIRVGGIAVSAYNGGRIANTGTIASTGGIAIGGTDSSTTATIVNAAEGTIVGTGGTAVRLYSGSFTNAGTVRGTVDMGYGFPYYAGAPTRSFAGSTYVADGGTIAGDLLFGSGNDTLVAFSALGVSGTIDGGAGIDTLVQARRTSDTVTLALTGVTNFEQQGVRAIGADTVVTVRAAAPLAGDLAVSGTGTIASSATISGAVRVDNRSDYVDGVFQPAPLLAGFTNTGTIASDVSGTMRRFSNSGTIGDTTLATTAVRLDAPEQLTFGNDGRIVTNGIEDAVWLFTAGNGIDATNAGTIAGGFTATLARYGDSGKDAPTTGAVTLANAGTITTTNVGGATVQLSADLGTDGIGTSTLTNTGTIEASGVRATAAFLGASGAGGAAHRIVVANSGTLRANGGGAEIVETYSGSGYRYTVPAAALVVSSNADEVTGAVATVTNAATGTIEATGARSVAIVAARTALDLANAGTIRGGAGTTLAADDGLAGYIGRPFLAGAVQSYGIADDRIVNTGRIVGSIDLGAGSDRIDNLGTIEGNVFLGAGDDILLQRASATLVGTVDAGAGNDLFVVDATGGGAINGDRFVNFERFSQIGTGSVTYSGTFRFDTVGVTGGTVTVAAGQTLTSDGPVTITGSDATETVVNDGTIAGGVSLAGGADWVVNRGTIGGAVLLGTGDDSYVEGAGSRASGGVDGGAGTDTYTALLAGDRTGLGARTGFERLAVEGAGTLALTLDQAFETTSLTGTGLTAALNGFTLGGVTGSDDAERLTVDGDVASVSLGAGDDALSIGAARAGGRYDGGTGVDVLRFTATGPVTLAGVATGFEQISLAGGALAVTGTLGSTGAPLAFGDGGQALTVAAGGMLAGIVDLGAGNDTFRLAAGATLAGTVAGGAGTDTATLDLAGNRALAATTLTGFETLATEGQGTLTLTGAHAYDTVAAATDLAIATDGSLAARQVRFGSGDQRFAIAGRFAGAIDGGAGTDTVTVSSGSATAPVAFTDVAGVEAFAMTGGYATVSGNAALGSVDMSGGRLVGLAGSTIAAAQIVVRRDATFGSAGTVTGNLAVAGTLSPGASPGTMTVNGNVSLASGSLSVFELTPTVQDRLVVNGTLQIASGATLQLVPTGTLRAGTSYDLITASGGITGGFTTVLKPDTLFGFVVQRADRIQLLGQFLGDASFTPQVARSVAYANAVLATQPATSTLFAALPALLTGTGASDPRAFAQLTPEAYASATQIGVENALALTDAVRGPGFAADRTEPGGFTFAQAIGSWYRLAADPAAGTNAARTTSYGFLGGIGYGDRGWSVGAFGGWLDSRQRIAALGTSTGADGWVAGAQGRYEANGFGFGASIAYNRADADTRRALPGAASTTGRYDLESWVSDVSVHYALAMGDWALRPRAGLTYLRTTRDRLVEAGGPFALTVARDRHVAGFADAGVGVARGEASEAAFRPFVSLGVRYQIEGRCVDALAGYAGGPLGLSALGAVRTRAVGTASAGVTYRLAPTLDLFSTVSAQTGRDDHREAIATGVRLRF